MRTGKGSMAGPADTAIGYGKGWATVSNTPFREYKHWVHEGGISTPLIAHWPAIITGKGELNRTPSHLVDLMATAVDLAEATYPKQFHGGESIYPMEGKVCFTLFSVRRLTVKPFIGSTKETERYVRAIGSLLRKVLAANGSSTTLPRIAVSKRI